VPRPECPLGGNWELFFLEWHGDSVACDIDVPSNYTVIKTPHSALIGHGEPAGPGPITNIVEFHDCQQFIAPIGSGKRYVDLFEIIARNGLDAAFVPRARRRLERPLGPTPRAWVNSPLEGSVPAITSQVQRPFDLDRDGILMATMFAYRALKLERGFNCLHFFRRTTGIGAPGWVATITPVGPDAAAWCDVPLPASAATGPTVFAVDRGPTMSTSAIPPVARWDWDARNQRQYIGIRCDDAWCKVEPKAAPGGVFLPSTLASGAPTAVKGWYDEQLLAVPPAGMLPVTAVSGIMGSLIPEPDLGIPMGQEGETSIYLNTWKAVASVRLDALPRNYTSKLNIVETAGTTNANHVALCYGITKNGRNPCVASRVGQTNTIPNDVHGVPCSRWFARVGRQPNGSGNEKYFCVTRRGHDSDMNGNPMPRIPGVVRWRWALKDETMWIRCLQGCCEVKAL